MKKMYRVLGKRGRITIPYEIRQRVGFGHNDVLSFTEGEDGRTVTIRREKLCDNCVQMTSAPQSEDEVSLYDFLNSLSPAQQHAAMVHLSVKWAYRQGGQDGGA